ncbi:uncharacterized protein LOC133815746 [Humulus lupulus]|uniref:uncharacterized protein LOC133815746 n=1 Tax=Humulus lupulus TaxID=3486 RepID=UPI002B411EAF|nr:uncharacterized protein LOC133815746 [Humulus lupulus]
MKVGLVGFLETRVQTKNLGSVYLNMFSGWCSTSNNAWHKGGRIMVSWNPSIFLVNIIQCTSQLMHLGVTTVSDNECFLVTFVYAFNEESGRNVLWADLKELSATMRYPWLLLGDFNDILSVEERIGGGTPHCTGAFKECMDFCQMEDIKFSGAFFTWNNKQGPDTRLYSKIDRVMGNQAWLDRYQNAEVKFMNEGSFDHCPALLQVYPEVKSGKKPFRYFRMWQKAPGFHEKLQEVWQEQLFGAPMHQLVQKLKSLKIKLKELNRLQVGDIHLADYLTLQELLSCQSELQLNPRDKELIIKEKKAQESRVYSIKDKDGVQVHDHQQITAAFLNYYDDLLGSTMVNRMRVVPEVITLGPLIIESHVRILLCPYTNEEVKDATFAISGNKSPGPDGYSSFFFQDNWEMVGEDVSKAVKSFLHTGLKEDFQFYDRCEKLKLNHLCFTDDVLLFCLGDFKSIYRMLQGLKHFSQSPGLLPSKEKTSIYCSNMTENEVQRVMQISGFHKNSLPFTYLGIPICAKKIPAAECEVILERMVQRIRVWSSRNLSYAGRATLVNSVLMAIHSYWAQVMIIPKKILHRVNAICRNYFWKGTVDSTSSGQVAWEDMCRPKKEGGLGFRRITKWNEAAIGKYVWVVSSKQDTLWVQWVHAVCIGGRDWWAYEAPSASSWY